MGGQASRENGKKGGRPIGAEEPATREKREARRIIREHFVAHLPEIVRAQVAHAKGVSYMRLRATDGTFVRATDEKQIDAAIAAGATWFQIFTEVPNVQAFVALSDRAIDKPSEHVELTGKDGQPLLDTVLSSSRKRLASLAR